MPVNSTHVNYDKFLNQWTRCRDVVDGSDAVKGKGETYLPKLLEQSSDEYEAYKTRALFFSVSGSSLAGLVGTMTRRPPVITKGDDAEAYFKDTSLSGVSFNELFTMTSHEVLKTGRFGILIDWPEAGGRAYLSTYITERILNWTVSDDGTMLTSVVLEERIMVQDEQDKFVITEESRYRYLYLNDNGKYTVELYDNDAELIKGPFNPVVRGEPINIIPFYSITPFGLSIEPIKPPILDIVDVNLSQYLSSADLEHGRHFTALPTAVVSGEDSDTSLKIGSTTAWVLPSKDAKAYYMEFLGEGLKSLENAIKEKTSQMAQFSARLMDTSSRGSEAADTVRLRHAADSATMVSVATAIENGFNLIYGYIKEFERLDEILIQLHKDFLDTKLSATDIKELTESLIKGGIDQETFIYLLNRGESLPPGKTTLNSTVTEETNDE